MILDVDANLSALKRKWGDSIEGAPVATSTKKNAAKFIFRVPEELWGEVVAGHGEDHNAGYEVLWGQQGLIFGEYPGSKDGKWEPGIYGFEGDPFSVPVALVVAGGDEGGKTPTSFIKIGRQSQ